MSTGSSVKIVVAEDRDPDGLALAKQQPGGTSAGSRRFSVFRLFAHLDPQYAGLLGGLVVLLVVLSAVAPHFLTIVNLLNTVQNASFLGIIALGMTLVIILAEIDISVGSAMALYSALLGVLVTYQHWPLWSVIVLVLLLGAALGAGIGYIRHRFNVPSFIVTLAGLTSFEGVAQWLTNSSPIALPTSGWFSFLGGGRVAGVPFPLIVFLVLFLVFWFVASRTTFGTSVYAVGGNPQAARVAGISLRRARVLAFAGTGILAAVAGILLSSLIGSGNSDIGNGAEFQVIAAVIVGGTSLYGGRGSMVGTLIGVLFIAVLNDGLVLLGANQYLQEVAQGIIILGAVLINEWLRGRDPAAGRRRRGIRLPSSVTAGR
jgi:simple sugar transport system permease protein